MGISLSAFCLISGAAKADDHYWVVEVNPQGNDNVAPGLADDGTMAMSGGPIPEVAHHYDIYTKELTRRGFPSYSAYETMTLFVMSGNGNFAGRGNAQTEKNRPIGWAGEWLDLGDPRWGLSVEAISNTGNIAASGLRDNPDGPGTIKGRYGYYWTGSDWVPLPVLHTVEELTNPDDPGDKAEFHTPRWISADGTKVCGSVSYKWFGKNFINGEYLYRASCWSQRGKSWDLKQLRPAPEGWTENCAVDDYQCDIWRSDFIDANDSGESVGWVQQKAEEPLLLAKHDSSGWTLLNPLNGTLSAVPADLNDNGIAVGNGQATGSSKLTDGVAVVWDIRANNAWNLNRSVDRDAVSLIIKNGVAINNRGQILAKARCAEDTDSDMKWYILSPKVLGSPNFSAHEVPTCNTEPREEELGNPGNGNENDIPPPSDTGTTISCTGTDVRCGDMCVDTSSNSSHCGGCGRACPDGLVCSDGECMCSDGLTACGDDCVNTSESADHCGGCDNACAASQVCSQGACADECAGGLEQCGRDCADLQSSLEHCGACGNACDLENAVAACVAAACAIERCDPGASDADGIASNGCESTCTPQGPETCNGADDDCDGEVDEGLDCQGAGGASADGDAAVNGDDGCGCGIPGDPASGSRGWVLLGLAAAMAVGIRHRNVAQLGRKRRLR